MEDAGSVSDASTEQPSKHRRCFPVFGDGLNFFGATPSGANEEMEKGENDRDE